MLIKAGFNITLECAYQTPMVLMMSVHPDRRADLLGDDDVTTTPSVHVSRYTDKFGNLCQRLVAPAGPINLHADFVVSDSGSHDPVAESAEQIDVSHVPAEALQFLMASRYCETDLLMATAWQLFGHTPPGWARAQAIVDFVHNHLTFGYPNARNTRTAYEAFQERVGVCRDFTHLAVAFCRCMNIPARYCNGYLGDIGVPPDPAPMDFNAWFEVFLGGRWLTLDARHNTPRIGRILIARGMDAADVAMVTAFGNHMLRKFEVTTEEVLPVVEPPLTETREAA